MGFGGSGGVMEGWTNGVMDGRDACPEARRDLSPGSVE
jgi:hypothetical protein